MDEDTDFGMFQLSHEDVGFGRSGKSQLELMVVTGFGEDLVFDFSLEAEQRRHDVRALDVNHKSDLSLSMQRGCVRAFAVLKCCRLPFSRA